MVGCIERCASAWDDLVRRGFEALWYPGGVGSQQSRLKEALEAGAWCWPSDDDECRAALDAARMLTGRSVPCSQPDASLLVSVHPGRDGAALWALDLGGEMHSALPRGVLEPKLQDVFRLALRSVSKILPWQLHGLNGVSPANSRIRRLCSSGFDAGPNALGGESYGVMLALAMASRAIGLPVREDLAGTGSLARDGSGRIDPVASDSLERKLRILWERAPRVRFVLIPAQQELEAREILRRVPGWEPEHLDLKPVATLSEALSLAFDDPSAVADRVISRNPTDRQIDEQVRRFLRILDDGHRAAAEWAPVAAAALLAMERWRSRLTDCQRWLLQVTLAVAQRHESNGGRIPNIAQPCLKALRRPDRLSILRHCVQHATDTGTPDPAETLALASAELPADDRDDSAETLKLAGAIGRLYREQGDLHAARALQRRALTGWIELGRHLEEASFPLSELLLLAHLARDRDCWEQAVAARESLAPWFDPVDRAYIDLAHARAALTLDTDPVSAVIARLERLVRADSGAPAHVRLSGMRWLARAARAAHDQLTLDATLAQLKLMAADTTAGSDESMWLTLAELDAAVETNSETKVVELIRSLSEFSDPVLNRLLKEPHRERSSIAKAARLLFAFPY